MRWLNSKKKFLLMMKKTNKIVQNQKSWVIAISCNAHRFIAHKLDETGETNLPTVLTRGCLKETNPFAPKGPYRVKPDD